MKKENPACQRPGAVTGEEARRLLMEGNGRFVEGRLAPKDLGGARREELASKGQKPFAVIVTCSDSRVPPEILFDQALGDLFVIRVAGNVVDQVALGSVEYAVEHLNTPLVVVMGHEKCGAVQAAVDGGEVPGSIGAIVSKIRPSVQKAAAAGAAGGELYEKTADENIKSAIEELKKSPVIRHFMEEGRLMLIGAKYHLSSGRVVFYH
ncbi:carbonic anhydrase [Pelotomaculum thermopropionicum SI]|uniref:Carbonic anhydrase n=1 Tax=Pelotomaculum thermopropionicum (strain DSM 13744 / JCM 10971 / SI) TaxID=370438 RepID=A5CYU0_PELTS|nr:carbonic anhydrase [Pelotomaculum thermopropionicum SI]